MVQFIFSIPHSEIEEERKKKGHYSGLVEQRLREEAAKHGLVISGDLLESVSVVVWSSAGGMVYTVTSPPEKTTSSGKIRKKRWK